MGETSQKRVLLVKKGDISLKGIYCIKNTGNNNNVDTYELYITKRTNNITTLSIIIILVTTIT